MFGKFIRSCDARQHELFELKGLCTPGTSDTRSLILSQKNDFEPISCSKFFVTQGSAISKDSELAS
jgi:hypothetical protein